MGVIIGILLRTYIHHLGTLAVLLLVFNVEECSPNNNTSYILFYS